jgi:hypothetical protein
MPSLEAFKLIGLGGGLRKFQNTGGDHIPDYRKVK